MKNSRKIIAIIMAITILFTSFSNEIFAEDILNSDVNNELNSSLTNDINAEITNSNEISEDSNNELGNESLENSSEETPEILCEVEELRGENYKQFLLSDKSYMIAMYDESIHQIQNGTWEEIDNTLTESEVTDSEDFNGLENTNNDTFKVKFAKSSSSKKLLTIKNGNGSISFSSIKGIKKVKSNKKNDNKKDKKQNKQTDINVTQENIQEIGQTVDVTEKGTAPSITKEVETEIQSQQEQVDKSTIDETTYTEVETIEDSTIENTSASSQNTQSQLSTQELTTESSVEKLTLEESISDYLVKETNNDGTKEIIEETSEVEIPANEVIIEEVKSDEPKEKEDTKNKFLSVEKLSTEVRYNNILPNIDLQYILTGSQLKENIIIKEKSDNYDVAFEMNLKKLAIKQNSDGSVDIIKDNKKSKEEIVFQIPTPFMYDANGEISTNVYYEITPSDKKDSYIFKIIADNEWINKEDRAFPVTIDPAVIADKSKKTVEYACVGETGNLSFDYIAGNNGKSKYRVYAKPINLPQLGKLDVIVKAEFSTKCSFTGNYGLGLKYELLEVKGAWNQSTINWSNQPLLNYTPVDYCVTPSAVNYSLSFDITKLAKEWYQSGSAINGIVLKAVNESLVKNINMYSTEDIKCEFLPTFSIIYRNQRGLEEYWDYKDVSAGVAGTGFINKFTGNLVLVHNDLAMNGNRMPLNVYHVYSTDLAGTKFDNTTSKTNPYTNLNVGYGFKLNLQQTMKEFYAGDFSYVYVDEDATEHHFINSTTIWYVSEDGLGYTARYNPSEKKYILRDKHKNTKQFNEQGYLTQIVDSNYNTININYDNSGTRIESATDGAGRITKFTYNGNNYLSKITDPSGRSTSYYYSTTYNGTISSENGGFLRTIIYPDGTNSNYTYYADGTLESVKDLTNTGLKFQYTTDTSKRVTKVTEQAGSQDGESIKIKYETDGRTVYQTVGTDGKLDTSDDLISTFNFDSWGRSVVAYKENINNTAFYGAVINEYNPDELKNMKTEPGKVNKVVRSSIGYKTIVNELSDSSAEYDNKWYVEPPKTSISYTAGYTNDKAYIGKKSLKIKVDDSTTSSVSITQDYKRLVSGATYTFSAYVKTSDITTGVYDVGARLCAETVNVYGAKVNLYSELVTGTTDENINNGWKRIQVTFTAPTYSYYVTLKLELRNTKGIAWFDGMQLEKEEIANIYNLMENSGFEVDTAYYSKANITNGDIYPAEVKEGLKCYRILGGIENNNRISQTIEINKTGAQSYVLSGWGKADSALSGGTKKYAIGATINYTDRTTQSTEFSFNRYNNGWQYISGAIVPDKNKNVSSITVEAIYDNNTGIAYFDNLCLVSDMTSSSYTYDANGNLLSATNNSTKNYSYTEDNNLSTVIIGDLGSGARRSFEYDICNNLTREVTESNVTTDYTYDRYGNMLTSAVGNKSYPNLRKLIDTATYTANGNYLSSIKNNMGYTTLFNYDQNKGTLSNITDVAGKNTRYIYDPSNDLLKSTYLDLNNNGIMDSTELQNSYNYTNNKLTSIDNNGFKYNIKYNNFGDMSSITVNNQNLIQYMYASNSRKLSGIIHYGLYITYDYDSLNRIVGQRYSGNLKYQWKYDQQGNIAKLIDSQNSITYNYDYDNVGRLIRQNSNRDLGYEVGYDAEGRVEKVAYQYKTEPSKTEKITYRTDGRAINIKQLDNSSIKNQYDDIGRLNTKYISTGSSNLYYIKEEYAYKSGSGSETTMVESVLFDTLRRSQVGPREYAKLRYTYDARGNIETISENTNSASETSYVQKVKYYYDDLSQLKREDNAWINKTIVYTYDLGGNITSKTEYGYTTGNLGQIIKTTPYAYTNEWKDLLTSYNGMEIKYSGSGNPTTYLGSSLKWEYGKSLSQYQNGNKTITYKYDIDGLRKTKDSTIGGVTTQSSYSYNGGNLIRQQTGNDIMWYMYDENGSPTGLIYNGVSYHYNKNLQGDVIRILNTEGNIVASYVYDTWGKVISINDTNGIGKINPIRYRGYYYDEETGWYYLNSRYYDPEVGRFLNADDAYVMAVAPMSLNYKNLFSYCDNNPVIRKDASGALWDTVIDLFSTASSIKDVCENPTSKVAWASLAADIACLVVPVVTGGGTIVKAVAKGDDIVDGAKAVIKGGSGTKSIGKTLFKSNTTSSFWKDYNKLPKDIQKAADKAFDIFSANPTSQSLHFEDMPQLGKNVWSARINDKYRALGRMNGNTIEWYAITNHYAK